MLEVLLILLVPMPLLLLLEVSVLSCLFSCHGQHSPTSLRDAVAPAVKTREYSSELAPRNARTEDRASETMSELRPPECGLATKVEVSSFETAST